jgi:hypothetical protein
MEFTTKNYQHVQRIINALLESEFGFERFRGKASEVKNADFYIYERKGVIYMRETPEGTGKNQYEIERIIEKA